jgi:hypothetical protein
MFPFLKFNEDLEILKNDHKDKAKKAVILRQANSDLLKIHAQEAYSKGPLLFLP